MDISLVNTIVAMLQQHQPWLLDKAGGALMAQPIRELWELAKRKLGSASTEKVEQHPADADQWELFRVNLLVALAEDPAFREKIQSLVQAAGISQQATGNNNVQNVVKDSTNVKISIR